MKSFLSQPKALMGLLNQKKNSRKLVCNLKTGEEKMKIKTLSGHLTSLEKKVIRKVFELGASGGMTKRKSVIVNKVESNLWECIVKENQFSEIENKVIEVVSKSRFCIED
jgi:hypothetical protein